MAVVGDAPMETLLKQRKALVVRLSLEQLLAVESKGRAAARPKAHRARPIDGNVEVDKAVAGFDSVPRIVQ